MVDMAKLSVRRRQCNIYERSIGCQCFVTINKFLNEQKSLGERSLHFPASQSAAFLCLINFKNENSGEAGERTVYNRGREPFQLAEP